MKLLGSHWTDFHELLYLIFLENLSRKLNFHLKRKRITGTLHEDQYAFMIISRSIIFRIRNDSDKSCRENKSAHCVFNSFFFFSKIVPFMR